MSQKYMNLKGKEKRVTIIGNKNYKSLVELSKSYELKRFGGYQVTHFFVTL